MVVREEDSQISLDVECRPTKAVTSCYGGIVHVTGDPKAKGYEIMHRLILVVGLPRLAD